MSILSHNVIGSIGQRGNIPSGPLHTTLSSLSIPSQCTVGRIGQSHPHYPYPHCPSHPNVPWEGLDSVGTSQAVPSTLPLSPLSTPSQCTVGRNGQHGNIPTSPIHATPIPTVHPIPMYRGKDWTAREYPKKSHPHYPYPHCPSHPNVPYGLDSVGTSQAVPSTLPLSPLSIPSQCTVGRIGQRGNIPSSPIHTTPIPTVHPIPIYSGKDWTPWEHPK